MAFSLLSFKGLVGLLIVVGRTLVSALVDVPSVEDYVRRTSARATVLGNYLYIDGGIITQLENGVKTSNDFHPVNSTLSIPLASSWTPSTVAISAIPKTGPIKNNVYLWTDASTKSFYSFGGQWLGGRNITSSALWKFTADDSGGGIWSLQAPSNANLFKQLHPTEYGIFANTPTTGFVLGGDASPSTELDRTVRQSIPGMVAFNMDTKVWQNGTAGFSPLPASTVVYRGAAHYVPSFNGPNGLILIMGGFHMQMDDPRQTGQTANFFDLGNLTFFDPETKKTYWQSTTGDIPETPRSGFCVAGFRDEQNGSYEIFLLGGRNERDRFPYQNAYVLSLPGFVWRRLPDLASGPRFDHTCVAVGGRQILSIGGYTGQRWEKDEAPQGLLLFDAAEWKWKDKYEPDAGAYLRNEEIGRWYADGSLSTVPWSAAEVERLFSSEGADSPDPNLPDPTVPDNQPSTGAIVGGVVGGIAGLAVIAALVWFFLFRRRRSRNKSDSSADTESANNTSALAPQVGPAMVDPQSTPELDRDCSKSEMEARSEWSPPIEVDGSQTQRRTELMGTSVVELDAGEVPR